MFPTQIDATSTQEQCVINVGPQKEYADDKRSFVSVEYPGDDRTPHLDVNARMAGLSMSSKVACEKK
eukprot:13627860-Ditylum_brightwellii.AAC.1